MADGVDRRSRRVFATGLARDFEAGVTARPVRVVAGEHVILTELMLASPRDQPLHCPPAVTQVHVHKAGRTHRLVSHDAARP